MPTATQTTLTAKQLPLHALCHLSPLVIQHPQQTPSTELLMPTKHQFTEGQQFQTVQLPPPSLHSPIDSLTEILNSMGNLLSSILKSLQQQFARTHTLLDRLNQWLLPAFTSASSRITSKNLFELITDLSANDPIPLFTTTSSTPTYLTNNLPTHPTRKSYWIPPKSQDFNKTRIIPYLPTTLLWSTLQFTIPHSKDLLKVP